MTPPTIDIRPLAGALGAEVFGVNLSKPLHDDLFAAVHETFLRYHVLCFSYNFV